MVRQTPGAFGYVELTYALQNKIEYGAVKNAAGKFLLGTAGWRYGCGGCVGQDDAGGLPGLDHERAGADLLSDLQLYLAADSEAVRRSGEGRGGEGLPGLDAGSRRERGGRAWAMPRFRRQVHGDGEEDDYDGQVD